MNAQLGNELKGINVPVDSWDVGKAFVLQQKQVRLMIIMINLLVPGVSFAFHSMQLGWSAFIVSSIHCGSSCYVMMQRIFQLRKLVPASAFARI